MASDPVRLPVGKEPTLRIVPMPADTNYAGNIFGGWILSQVDIAGSIAAIRRARGPITTVAVNSVEFHEPVFVGDLVSCYAQVTRVGRTSITVEVQVYAERNRAQAECIKVTEAVLTYVALDEHRRPRAVPPEDG
ncbi:MAG: acyl-CoA thioesterase [Rhodospirillales bacterium]|nr:acyl-CoA thioesterase [Rhodospirillales bacterium]